MLVYQRVFCCFPSQIRQRRAQAEIFLDAIDALFGDVKDERQVHLFNSLQTSASDASAPFFGKPGILWIYGKI
jgi:hypothetical protein